MILESIHSPSDLKALSLVECDQLAAEIRDFIVEAVSRTGGHLGSNLGVVELTLALHRVFNSPEDVLLFDTGHQAYVHKIVTGRQEGFVALKQEGGLSGYPSRAESPHDWVENSHASTALSYAHGIATALSLQANREPARDRHVVAVVGDGALTGGMAYEALNNLGHSGAKVLVVLNDNGRSYAPTVSRLSVSLTQLRLDPRYLQVRDRVRHLVEDLPGGVSSLAFTSFHGLSAAIREVVGAAHVLRGARYPLHGTDRRARCRGARAGPSPGRELARPHRSACRDHQGEGVRTCGGRRDRLSPRSQASGRASLAEPPGRTGVDSARRAAGCGCPGEWVDRRRRSARAS